MTGGIRISLTIAACAMATAAVAQAPAPATTAFDGIYIGTATIAAGSRVSGCSTVTSVDMTIAGGQVVIHEALFQGGSQTFRGSANAAGEVSTFQPTSWGARLVDSLSGKIEDKVFTGRHMHGYWCHWSVQMAPAPPPTMPFDGDYIGVSRESNGGSTECPKSHVPADLIIRNSVVLGVWEGTVSLQGAIVMRNPTFSRVDAQIDPQGTISGQFRGQYRGSSCTVAFVWRKRSA
jgi:hypothetical protein